jgi:S1-C subfamily serine protease
LVRQDEAREIHDREGSSSGRVSASQEWAVKPRRDLSPVSEDSFATLSDASMGRFILIQGKSMSESSQIPSSMAARDHLNLGWQFSFSAAIKGTLNASVYSTWKVKTFGSRLARSLTPFLGFALVLHSANADSIPDIVARAKPAIIEVVALNEENQPIKTGTGFFITGDGVAVTNFHVIEGASSLTAMTNDGAFFAFEKVLYAPPGVDLAILKFAAHDAHWLKLGRSDTAVEGQRVLVIGNPHGLQGTVSDGLIAGFRDNRSLIQITAPISPGSSGSPVLDDNGQVIGVATLIEVDGQNLNFAIPVESVGAALASLIAQQGTQQHNPETATAPAAAVSPSPGPAPGSSEGGQSSASFVIAVDQTFGNHDWQTLTRFTVDGLVNYFGHRYATNAYIARDMQGDARNYAWVHSKPYPETFTHEVSDEYSTHWNGPMLYDSINVYSEALEKNGRLHKATTRFTVGYTVDSAGRIAIYSPTLKVL